VSLVATSRTTPSMSQFVEALLRACPEISKKGAAILWAHFAGETGSGRYCWNWNLGNVKWSKGCGLDYVSLAGVWEVINGQRVQIPKEDPGSWFRAYPSLEAGMHAFVESKRAGRWTSTWPFVEAGDPEGYAAELKRHGYFTAPLADYQRSMRMFFDAFVSSKAFEQAQRRIGAEVATTDEDAPDTLVDFQVVHPVPDTSE
jgi:flagellum-specific peptidoglycan hydrolase FlgJ